MRAKGVGLLALGLSLACGGGESPPAPVVEDPMAAIPSVPEHPVAVAGGRCPTGTQVITTWQGEYPGHVVDVKSAFTTSARKEPCDQAASAQCAVSPGVYHPWSTTTTAKFATVQSIESYKARRAYKWESREVPAGDVVEVHVYFGEGFCSMKHNGQEFEGECPQVVSDDQGEVFEKQPGPAEVSIEVLGVTCADGSVAWLDVDDALFALPEVEEGAIRGYGEVGPAE